MSRPNVVWITLDSVRADHTTMAGYERETTPSLARLADDERGAYFENCLSHGRYTAVSSASILTGVYPSRHRVGYDGPAIPAELRTVPERFREAGYRTGLVSDNPFVSEATGLDRGFDSATCLVPASLAGLPSTLLKTVGPAALAKYVLGIRRHSVGLQPDLKRHSRTYLINVVAKRWLASVSGEEPFFLYVHNNDPHRPYYPALPSRDAFTADIAFSSSEAAAFSMRVHESLMRLIAEGCSLTGDEWEALLAMYDAEISHADAGVGELVQFIDDGGFGETLVVVTADHGEFFGEHGLLGHKFVLDDAVLNVPLVVRGIDTDGDGLVQHSDVIRTLLECAGGETDGIHGVDIRHETREFAIAQDHRLSPEQLLEHDPTADISRYPSDERSVIHDGRFKLRLGEDGRVLYRLPDETTDVSASHADVANDMEATLREWLAAEGQPAGEVTRGKFTDSMRRHLADLGYVDDELPDSDGGGR